MIIHIEAERRATPPLSSGFRHRLQESIEHAASALCNLALEPCAQDTVAEAGAVPILAKLQKSKNSVVKKHATGAIKNLRSNANLRLHYKELK